jgi:FkbM family methyltransferase
MGAIHFSLDPNLVRALRAQLPLESFVETGTFRGDTAHAMAPHFPSVHTIELADELYARAVERLAPLKNVTVVHGSSPEALKSLWKTLSGKSVLYWLDAHWCGGPTSGAAYECPVLAEIAAIRSLNDQSVVLIDDARFFIAPPPHPHAPESWPLIAEVIAALTALSDRHKAWIINDVLIFAPEVSAPDIVGYGRKFGIDLEALHFAAVRAQASATPGPPPAETGGPPPFAFNAGVDSEERSERLFAYHLARLGISQVLDIGANTGQFAAKLRKYGYDGVIHSVEPQAAAHAGLLANAANDLRWLPTLRQGLGDAAGRVELNVSENSYSSSILQVQADHVRAAPQAHTVARETIYVNRASNLFRDEVMSSIEAVKMDVQGYEKHVLDGLAPYLATVRLLMLEMSLVECYAGEVDLFTLDRFLTDQCGFSRISLEPSYYDDRAGVVQQYDGIYGRPDAGRPADAPASRRGVTLGAFVTSIGGSEQRLNERGVDVGADWHRACRQAARALTGAVISVSEVAPLDPDITWVEAPGRPAMVDLLAAGVERSSEHLLIANADIMFNQAFRTVLGELAPEAVYYGRRHDVRENEKGSGPLRVLQPYEWGFDYFLMPGAFARIVVAEGLLPAEFRIGEPWWDYLIPVLAHALGFPVKRIGPQRAIALHYVHDQRFAPKTWAENGNRFVACLKALQQSGAPFAQSLLAELLGDPSDRPDLQRIADLISHRLA